MAYVIVKPKSHVPALPSRCKQHKRTRVTSQKPVGGLLSHRLPFSMANHATASTSTLRCANVNPFPIPAIKLYHVPQLRKPDQTALAPPAATKSCLDFLVKPNNAPVSKIKPNLVGACIQKRFEVTLGLVLDRVPHFLALSLMLDFAS